MLILECLYSHSVSCKVRPHPGITTQTLYEPGSQRTRTTRKGALANGASTIQLCHRGDRACWSCTSDFSKKIFVQFFSKLRENVCVCVWEREREKYLNFFMLATNPSSKKSTACQQSTFVGYIWPTRCQFFTSTIKRLPPQPKHLCILSPQSWIS